MRRMAEFARRLAEMPTEKDWDSYGAEPTTEAAKDTAAAMTLVPVNDGGVQFELHAGGAEIAIEVGADGTVTSVFWERAAASTRKRS
jgi:hypothetical protein